MWSFFKVTFLSEQTSWFKVNFHPVIRTHRLDKLTGMNRCSVKGEWWEKVALRLHDLWFEGNMLPLPPTFCLPPTETEHQRAMCFQ